MKNCTMIILALVAAVAFVPPLAGSLTVTITEVRGQGQDASSAIVVTLSNSTPASKRSAEAIVAAARGGIAFVFCDLPAGIYSAVVLSRRE